MAQLLLDNVSKTYRPRGKEPVQAVSQVSLEVKDGEIVALLGSSGCGKTSMLRMIAGFEDVTAGAIRIGGKEIHLLPPAQRDVIELIFWGGLTRREVADRLRLPLGTVHTRLRLGMEKLRMVLRHAVVED